MRISKLARGQLVNAYDYCLPNQFVAQRPADKRVKDRLLILSRQRGELVHQQIAHLTRYLNPCDLLVFNNTRVVPARFKARRSTGGKVEILFLAPAHPVTWKQDGQIHKVLLRPQQSLIKGQELILDGNPSLVIKILYKNMGNNNLVWLPGRALDIAWERGYLPFPPYISRKNRFTFEELQRYQTIYAAQAGAVAAPTAGLHFSSELLAALVRRGVKISYVTLHVGYGTFAKPLLNDLRTGRLYTEWIEIPSQTNEAVIKAKRCGGRIIAVGTTSLRALEWRSGLDDVTGLSIGWCDLFITPGFVFQVVDGIITNFHLPCSTLLMLVSALVGRERMLLAYSEAILKKYRFYSFGDAMLII